VNSTSKQLREPYDKVREPMKIKGMSHIEMAYSFNPLMRLIFYVSSITHVLLTVFLGYLISLKPTINPLIFVFAVTSKLFAIMFAEDRNASKKTKIYSTIALALAIPLLKELSSFEMIIGFFILMLYSLYPISDGKAPFDIIHHAIRYVLIFTLGYGEQTFNDDTALLALLTIALFSLVGELLAGLRWSKDLSKSTVSLLGIKKSLIMIISIIFVTSFIASYVFNRTFEFPIQINKTFIPFYIIPALALGLYLTKPLIKALNEKRIDAFYLIRKKEIKVMIFMSLLVLAIFQTVRISTKVVVSSRNYSFDLGIRTIIAGKNSWDVPWIVFDYINEDNYYYIVFHKDGILELSQKMDGQCKGYIASLKTQLTPFQWHNFHTVLNETTIVVTLDGKYQVTTSRYLTGDAFSIIISPSLCNWLACIYSINITLVDEHNN